MPKVWYGPRVPKVWYHTVIKKNSENSLDAVDAHNKRRVIPSNSFTRVPILKRTYNLPGAGTAGAASTAFKCKQVGE